MAWEGQKPVKKGEKIDFFDFFKSIQKVFGNTLGVLWGHTKHLSALHTSFLPLDPDFHGFTPLQNGTWTGEAQQKKVKIVKNIFAKKVKIVEKVCYTTFLEHVWNIFGAFLGHF